MKYLLSELIYKLKEQSTQIDKKHQSDYNDLKNYGFLVKENFLSKTLCEELVLKFDNLYDQNIYSWIDEEGSDVRLFGIEAIDEKFQVFNHELLDNIYRKYIGKLENSFVMANRVKFQMNNVGSGGGWHRDSMNRRQLKFILYLTDVTDGGGCFQYIKSSHNISQKLQFNLLLKKNFGNPRYSDEEIQFLVKKEKLEISSLEGRKGTLIIADTGGIHRGKPIENGCRYALTNYMFDSVIPKEIEELLLRR
jgi:hypothetical protein